jgi:hypothetical protein
MMVMDNGDVIVTLSETAFLVVSGGTVTLHDKGNPRPDPRAVRRPAAF